MFFSCREAGQPFGTSVSPSSMNESALCRSACAPGADGRLYSMVRPQPLPKCPRQLVARLLKLVFTHEPEFRGPSVVIAAGGKPLLVDAAERAELEAAAAVAEQGEKQAHSAAGKIQANWRGNKNRHRAHQDIIDRVRSGRSSPQSDLESSGLRSSPPPPFELGGGGGGGGVGGSSGDRDPQEELNGQIEVSAQFLGDSKLGSFNALHPLT